MQRDINQLKGDVSQLKDAAAERRAESNIAGLLRRAQVLKSNHSSPDPDFSNDLYAAAVAGQITDQELEQLEAVDLIVRVLRREAATPEVHYAIEISQTVNYYAIPRARNRAAILGKALGRAARGAVIGGQIDEQRQQLATEMEVAAIPYSRLLP